MNAPPKLRMQEECASDVVHARLLSARVELHNGVWIVDDNVRLHDKFAVKLSVKQTCETNSMQVARFLLHVLFVSCQSN